MEVVTTAVAAGCRGDDRGLDDVIAEHQSALLRYAGRILNSADAAQDVVQEAFIRLHRHWGRGVGPDGRLKAWLYRTTHNAAVDHIRRESRRRLLHERHAEQEKVERDGPPPPEMEERRRLAIEQLNRLKPAEQQILILRLQEGLSYEEIARVTRRTTGNVGCLLHHATRKVAAGLKQAGVIP